MESKISKLAAIKIVLLVSSIIVFYLYFYLNNPSVNTLKINEVSFKNDLGYDWIEIYNPSIHTMNLKGMYITDDKMDLKKYKIKDDIIIEPGGFVVLYGNGYENDNGNYIKFNFGIKNGETIYLIDRQSLRIIDSLTVLTDDDVSRNSSIGRFPDGSEEIFLMSESSMGEANKKDMNLETEVRYE